MHAEYKIEFDDALATYFKVIIQDNEMLVHTDVKLFDSKLPIQLLNEGKYKSLDYTKNCIVNHMALNITLQDQIKEQEKELLKLNRKYVMIKHAVEHDVNYVKIVQNAFRSAIANRMPTKVNTDAEIVHCITEPIFNTNI